MFVSLARHTDNDVSRRDLSATKLEYTTQKLRQEWEAEKEQMQQEEQQIKAAAIEAKLAAENNNENVFRPIDKEETTPAQLTTKTEPIEIVSGVAVVVTEDKQVKEDTKSKKKRRKKSVLKKKNNTQRKNSSSSGQSDQNELEVDTASISINTSSNESSVPESLKELVKVDETMQPDDKAKDLETPSRIPELDIHFFSDTEAQTGPTPRRPSTPVQSDTEFEVSQREKNDDNSVMSNSASWKWGELPNQLEVAETKQDNAESKRSMLSGMFSFMKQGRKMRKTNEGLYLEDFENEDIDPEVAALYFPEHHLRNKEKMSGKSHEDDRESGNGTSVPQSPTSMEGIKSLDSDYDDGKQSDKYLDFVAISMCGGVSKGGPTDEEFRKHQVQFAEVSNLNFLLLFCNST